MSEYQYYEFQAIDRPLTEAEQQAVARLSSRVDPHPRWAVFTYSWSDFPGSAQDVLARYYDAMLYMANWGSTQLMFRFPTSVIDLEEIQAYGQPPIVEEYISFSTRGEYTILNIEFHDEGGGGWIEGERWLDGLIPLRDDILRGDYRALYLAWLKILKMEDKDMLDSVTEPPVPPGLTKLTPALESFVVLFGVDKDLIQVAAEGSGEPETISEDDLRRAITALTPQEKDAFLLRLAQGEPLLSLALKRRLNLLYSTSESGATTRRTAGELLAAAEALRERKHREQVAKAEARRIAELEALAQRQEMVWQKVDALIQESKAKAYDEAVRLLLKLKELAEYQEQTMAFQHRLDQLWELYGRRHGLLRRLRQAGLIPKKRG